MSYSISISIDDGKTQVLEARFLHVSLEDRGKIILYHDLIGHFFPSSLLGSRFSRSREGRIRCGTIRASSVGGWGHQSGESETAGEDKGCGSLLFQGRGFVFSPKFGGWLSRRQGLGLGFAWTRLPPIEKQFIATYTVNIQSIHLGFHFKAYYKEFNFRRWMRYNIQGGYMPFGLCEAQMVLPILWECWNRFEAVSQIRFRATHPLIPLL